MDSEVMNTSVEYCSISRSLEWHGKSKQTQVVKALNKILKTANILLSKVNHESISVKIDHSDRLCKAFSEKL